MVIDTNLRLIAINPKEQHFGLSVFLFICHFTAGNPVANTKPKENNFNRIHNMGECRGHVNNIILYSWGGHYAIYHPDISYGFSFLNS